MMPNMSYCRFENTNKDFEDCLEALNNDLANDSDLSISERNGRDCLYMQAKEFVQQYEYLKLKGYIK